MRGNRIASVGGASAVIALVVYFWPEHPAPQESRRVDGPGQLSHMEAPLRAISDPPSQHDESTPTAKPAVATDVVASLRPPFLGDGFVQEMRKVGVELSSEQLAALTGICLKTEATVLNQFAAFSKVSAPEAGVRIVDVALPPGIAEQLRTDFWSEFNAHLPGGRTLQTLDVPSLVYGIEMRLKFLGGRPVTFAFEGDAGRLVDSEIITCTETFRGHEGEPFLEATISGDLPRVAFQPIYGPLADQVLFAEPKP